MAFLLRHVLLVIDVQRSLFDPAPRPYEADRVISRINILSARARQSGVPVVFVQHENTQALAYESEGWQLHADLHTAPGDVVLRKTTPDAFHHTVLSDLLHRHGVTSLVVAGYVSEFCVDTTVRRAAALGYPVVLAADAHTTHDKPHADGRAIREHHNATLANITSFGPRIRAVASDEIRFDGA